MSRPTRDERRPKPTPAKAKIVASPSADTALGYPPLEAANASSALAVIFRKLKDFQILKDSGYNVLSGVATELARLGTSTTWSTTVRQQHSCEFSDYQNKDGITFQPKLIADVKVDQANIDTPFKALDIAVEISTENGDPVSRWHLDLANSKVGGQMQDGPRFHLQYGGHHNDNRAQDHPLAVPRWCHPPMEIGLVCEVIAANFYTQKWNLLRDDPSWCDAISQLERLCYSNYLSRITKAMNVASFTTLSHMWADRWK